MSETGQSPRNGLAKLLDEASPDDSPEDIVAKKQRYECPACGWVAELRRQSCFVCDHDAPLEPVQNSERGDV